MSWDGILYDKYKIAHTDGTPLKGRRYFVLRLDSDDPVEAARVRAAMLAYEKKPRNCDVGSVQEQEARFEAFCHAHRSLERCCEDCPIVADRASCEFAWSQLPHKEGGM